MSIALSKYVLITSGVGGAAILSTREYIARLYTINPLAPTKSVIEFTTLADVGTYFGTTSEEYKRASFYFGFINKKQQRPQKISFAFWAQASTAPRIYGAQLNQVLSNYTTVTNGALNLIIAGTSNVLTGMDFSGAASLAAVAAIIQAKIRTLTGTQYTAATVTYDAPSNRFIFIGGTAAAATVTIGVAGTGTDIANLVGWSTGAILSNGVLLETLTQVMTESSDTSNNFGSFAFLPVLNLTQVTELATWNSAQNVLFQYHVGIQYADAASYSAALLGLGGVGLTLSPTTGEYAEMLPMAILASTDYTKVNATQNFMFYQANLTPSVTKTTDSNTYDALRVNYYGSTQTAGQIISFYQRGILMGTATAPVDMNVYANEQWLKDNAGVNVMNLMLAQSEVPANEKGVIQFLGVLQATVNQALNNGVISVGKTLTNLQQQYITELSGDDKAWRQIQGIGYYLNGVIVPYTGPDNTPEYKFVYALIYSKDDIIRKVEGTHTLI